MECGREEHWNGEVDEETALYPACDGDCVKGSDNAEKSQQTSDESCVLAPPRYELHREGVGRHSERCRNSGRLDAELQECQSDSDGERHPLEDRLDPFESNLP